MATKQLTIVRPGTYGTRMLQAGDPYDATGPEARLYLKLGWMSEGKAPGADVYSGTPKESVVKVQPKRKRRAKKTTNAK